MKRYQSHKVVEAAPIAALDTVGGSPSVTVEGGERIEVPRDFFARGVPQPGDYLVRYEPDGYLSWSPKQVFEAGYRELP